MKTLPNIHPGEVLLEADYDLEEAHRALGKKVARIARIAA